MNKYIISIDPGFRTLISVLIDKSNTTNKLYPKIIDIFTFDGIVFMNKCNILRKENNKPCISKLTKLNTIERYEYTLSFLKESMKYYTNKYDVNKYNTNILIEFQQQRNITYPIQCISHTFYTLLKYNVALIHPIYKNKLCYCKLNHKDFVKLYKSKYNANKKYSICLFKAINNDHNIYNMDLINDHLTDAYLNCIAYRNK